MPPATGPFERRLQERAWEELGTDEWWFRRTYNLSPKDPRYLEMTKVEIIQEFWLHELQDKAEEADEAGYKFTTLDELLAFKPQPKEMTDKEFYRQLAELDAEDDRRLAEAQAARGTPSPMKQEDLVIDFHADPDEVLKNGR